LRYRRPFWLVIAALTVVLGATYGLIIRPYHLRWGATDQELALALPGDAATPADGPISTRAITIHAPAATVWAWLVQTGQNRGGGWHSYDWLENAAAAVTTVIATTRPTPGSWSRRGTCATQSGVALSRANFAKRIGDRRGQVMAYQ
jgi:hypothetical protein